MKWHKSGAHRVRTDVPPLPFLNASGESDFSCWGRQEQTTQSPEPQRVTFTQPFVCARGKAGHSPSFMLTCSQRRLRPASPAAPGPALTVRHSSSATCRRWALTHERRHRKTRHRSGFSEHCSGEEITPKPRTADPRGAQTHATLHSRLNASHKYFLMEKNNPKAFAATGQAREPPGEPAALWELTTAPAAALHSSTQCTANRGIYTACLNSSPRLKARSLPTRHGAHHPVAEALLLSSASFQARLTHPSFLSPLPEAPKLLSLRSRERSGERGGHPTPRCSATH